MIIRPKAPQIEPAEDTPLDPVLKWRTEQLEELGFDAYTASCLANDQTVDLGRARKLIASGCSHHMAVEILAS